MKIELLHHTPLWVCSKAIRKCWASEGKSDTPKCLTGEGTAVVGRPDDIRCNVCGHHFCQCEAPKIGTKDKELIYRIGNKMKHKSTLEHLVYTFDIDGISRACLQELARHRLASYSVKSTRYTLKELKNEESFIWHGKLGNMFGITNERYDTTRASKYVVLFGNEEDGTDSINQRLNSSIVTSLELIRRQLKDDSNDRAKYILPEAYKTSLVMTINARSLQNFLELRTSKSALWEIQDLAYALYKQLPEEHKYLFEEYLSTKSQDIQDELDLTKYEIKCFAKFLAQEGYKPEVINQITKV